MSVDMGLVSNIFGNADDSEGVNELTSQISSHTQDVAKMFFPGENMSI